MEKYIHRENLTLLTLLAEEEAKEPPPKNGILRSR
jgi:hypothetical protein